MGKSRNKNNYSIRENKIMWDKSGEKKFNQNTIELDDDLSTYPTSTDSEVNNENTEKNSTFQFTPFNDLFADFVPDK